MTAYFITGTGTDIGKTFVAAHVIRALKQRGQKVRALKPVASGYDPKTAAESDPGVLLAAMGEAVTEDNVARIAPWRFAAPLSPDMAAAREKRSIDFPELIAYSRKAIAEHEGTLLIENVGGIMVPLGVPRTTMDWMLTLNIPVVLVTGSYLGTLSHTLSAIDAILRRNLQIAAVVLNESAESTVDLGETAATLQSYMATSPASTAPLVTVKRGADEKAFEVLANVLSAK
ncbi:MAG: dethiobiotin synthase [Rhodospirillaceae bacterium]|nr:dethiobiotin synthase [Rhodospirillaceae bacterium]